MICELRFIKRRGEVHHKWELTRSRAIIVKWAGELVKLAEELER